MAITADKFRKIPKRKVSTMLATNQKKRQSKEQKEKKKKTRPNRQNRRTDRSLPQ